MKHLKPVYISILTIVVFAVVLLVGMQTQWWQTEGRSTPLDQTSGGGGHSTSEEGALDENVIEEDHENLTSISGSSTIQDALSLGIGREQVEKVLEGAVSEEQLGMTIKDIVNERGLKFGVIKDELNALIN